MRRKPRSQRSRRNPRIRRNSRNQPPLNPPPNPSWPTLGLGKASLLEGLLVVVSVGHCSQGARAGLSLTVGDDRYWQRQQGAEDEDARLA